MTIPLVVLAVLSVVSGWIGLPGNSLFHHFIHFGEEVATPNYMVMTLAILSSVLGIGVGYAVFMKRVVQPSIFREKLPWAYDLLANKYYLDEIYWAILVKPLFAITAFLAKFDQRIVGGFVNGVAKVTMGLAIVHAWFDKWIVDGMVNLVGLSAKISGRVLRFGQTGVVQNYTLVVFLGIIVIAWVYLFK
jgi:NADH-quinone oxidoreductase subunit L